MTLTERIAAMELNTRDEWEEIRKTGSRVTDKEHYDLLHNKIISNSRWYMEYQVKHAWGLPAEVYLDGVSCVLCAYAAHIDNIGKKSLSQYINSCCWYAKELYNSSVSTFNRHADVTAKKISKLTVTLREHSIPITTVTLSILSSDSIKTIKLAEEYMDKAENIQNAISLEDYLQSQPVTAWVPDSPETVIEDKNDEIEKYRALRNKVISISAGYNRPECRLCTEAVLRQARYGENGEEWLLTLPRDTLAKYGLTKITVQMYNDYRTYLIAHMEHLK